MLVDFSQTITSTSNIFLNQQKYKEKCILFNDVLLYVIV